MENALSKPVGNNLLQMVREDLPAYVYPADRVLDLLALHIRHDVRETVPHIDNNAAIRRDRVALQVVQGAEVCCRRPEQCIALIFFEKYFRQCLLDAVEVEMRLCYDEGLLGQVDSAAIGAEYVVPNGFLSEEAAE